MLKKTRVKTAAPTFQWVEELMMTRTKPYLTSTDSSTIKCPNIRTCKLLLCLASRAIALAHICRHRTIQRHTVPNNRLNSSSSFQICRWRRTQLQQLKSSHWATRKIRHLRPRLSPCKAINITAKSRALLARMWWIYARINSLSSQKDRYSSQVKGELADNMLSQLLLKRHPQW